jgi:hypothetical protein
VHNSNRTVVWLAAWFVLGLPLTVFAQTGTTYTNSFATVIGPSNAVAAFTTTYIGPQTIKVGTLGLCTASCTIGPGGTCGGAGPVLTGCAGGTPLVLEAGGTDIDTLLVTQVTALQAPQPIPLSPWLPIASAIGLALLAFVRLSRRIRR